MTARKTDKTSTKKSKDIFELSDLDKTLYCDTKVIAKIFGVTVRRIQQLTQDGTIETVETKHGKLYELFPTISRFVKFQADKIKNKGGSKREEDLKLQKLEMEIILKESQGELHKYKMDIQKGKYIHVIEVKKDYERFFDIFKKFALSIPSKVVNKLNGYIEPIQIRHIEKEIKEEVARQLRDFVMSATVNQEE